MRRQAHAAAAEWPDAGNGAKQRAFAGPRRATYEPAISLMDVHARCRDQGRPVRQLQGHIVEGKLRLAALGPRDPGFVLRLRTRVVYSVMKADQAVGGGLPSRESVVRADEPGKRALHMTECIGNLHQAAQLNRSGEISVSGDHEGKNDGGLVVADGEEIQDFLAIHDAPPVVDDMAEARAK